METPNANPRQFPTVTNLLRTHALTWTITAILPLPVLVATDPATSADVSCLYLGAGCAWLSTEIYRSGALPASTRDCSTKMLAIWIALAANLALFILFGLSADVQTHFPFPLMAALSVIPALGAIPWLARKLPHPGLALLAAALLIFAAKLLACVIARLKYGPDYIEQGYVSGDWRTAKLMISLFWIFSTTLSLSLLLADYITSKRLDPSTLPPQIPSPSPTQALAKP